MDSNLEKLPIKIIMVAIMKNLCFISFSFFLIKENYVEEV